MHNQFKPTMTLTKYRPQGTVMSPFNDLVNEFFGRDITQFLGHDDMKRSAPSVNITERSVDYKVELLAPGYDRQDLKLAVESVVLTISAERKQEATKENERFTRREFTHGSFSRSFRLPEGTQHDRIKAEYLNGVLNVIVPKVEVKKPSVRDIPIG
jgi:HSP20 family protein